MTRSGFWVWGFGVFSCFELSSLVFVDFGVWFGGFRGFGFKDTVWVVVIIILGGLPFQGFWLEVVLSLGVV